MSRTLINYLILIGCSLVWGTSYILIKKGLVYFTPYEVSALRMGITGLFVLPICLWRFKEIGAKHWPFLAVVGFLGNGIPSILFPLAQTEVPSYMAGTLNTLTPLFTLLIGVLVFRQGLVRNQIIGILLGMVGAIWLIFSQGGGSQKVGNPYFALFIVVATILYGMSTNTMKRRLHDLPSELILAGAYSMIVPIASIYLAQSGAFTKLAAYDLVAPTALFQPEAHNPYQGLYAIMLLAIVGTLIATIFFIELVKRTDAMFGSMVAYLMPMIAISWGFLDGEQPLMEHLLAFCLILAGVYMVGKK